jgi:thioredoxin-related protein
MHLIKKIVLLIFTVPILSENLMAAELIMVEQQGCYYCEEWKDQLGHIYPKTPEGKYAPLKTFDITEVDGIKGLERDVIFTPTFILMEKNKELGRLEGYSSEDFFWELLEVILEKETEYTAPQVIKTIN